MMRSSSFSPLSTSTRHTAASPIAFRVAPLDRIPEDALESKPDCKQSSLIRQSLPVLPAVFLLLHPTAASALPISLESFQSGFSQAFSLIFLSEIGDKTFFIAALLAAQTSKFVSFAGSLLALSVMTLISVVLGQLFHAVPSGITNGLPLDDYAAIAAFAFFGFKTLKDSYELDAADNSGIEGELDDAKDAVASSQTVKETTRWAQIVSTFFLVFAAEFGDRSFLATIALSAAQEPVSVAAGAIAGHAIATIIAVLTGSQIAKYISEKVIGYIGGSLFLVFAITTAFGIF